MGERGWGFRCESAQRADDEPATEYAPNLSTYHDHPPTGQLLGLVDMSWGVLTKRLSTTGCIALPLWGKLWHQCHQPKCLRSQMQDLRRGWGEVCNFYQVEKSSRFKISDVRSWNLFSFFRILTYSIVTLTTDIVIDNPLLTFSVDIDLIDILAADKSYNILYALNSHICRWQGRYIVVIQIWDCQPHNNMKLLYERKICKKKTCLCVGLFLFSGPGLL